MIKQKKGFTLIELLVVIAIIGILSAIGLVSLNGAREKARDSKARSDIATIRTAMALWYDDHSNTFPGEVVQNTADVSPDSVGSTATGIFLVSRPFTPEYVGTLKSPSSRTYRYITSSSAANASGTEIVTPGGGALSWALFYNLEGGGGTYFYKVMSNDFAQNVTIKDVVDADTAAAACTSDATVATVLTAGVCT